VPINFGGDALMDENDFWFCLTHHVVEPREGCRNQDRLGPYTSYADAAQALEHAAERNEAWDNDPDWNDDVKDAGPDMH
jgi:hypothetical protein